MGQSQPNEIFHVFIEDNINNIYEFRYVGCTIHNYFKAYFELTESQLHAYIDYTKNGCLHEQAFENAIIN